MSVLPSGLPEIVADDEPVARFLTSSNWFAATKGLVKPGAFLPNRNLETSVFRHGAEPVAGLWAIADARIDANVHGAGVVHAVVPRSTDLDVVAQETGPGGSPRHANIVGWPGDGNDPATWKEIWKDRANVIASKTELVLR